MKPKVFIGSSSERLDIAYTVKANLDPVAEVTVWTQGSFELTSSVFDNLISILNEYDFGIFIFWPEDTVKSRAVEYSSARDNVVFEFGLFTGGLGKTRTFFMYPRDQSNLRLPSDLNGILAATFESNRINETLEQACSQRKQSIQKEGVRKSRFERSGIIQINKPTILCASSAQYAQFEFDQDLAAIRDAFPDQ
jgi:predicted nucleotide-binding protein